MVHFSILHGWCTALGQFANRRFGDKCVPNQEIGNERAWGKFQTRPQGDAEKNVRSFLPFPLCRVIALAMALFVAEPAFGQQWLQRYLKEHKAKRTKISEVQPEATAQPSPTGDAAVPAGELEVRRALPADAADGTATDGTNAVPIAQPSLVVEPEVRRAMPVESATPEAAIAPTPADRTNTDEHGRTRIEGMTPASTPVLIRRAELVPFSPPPTSPTASSIVPAATAAPAPAVSVAAAPTPISIPAATPKPTPVPEAPVAKAVPTEQPSPTAAESVTPEPASTELDPKTEVITLSPGAAPQPPDVAQINYANDFYSKKAYDRAAPEYERYLALYPNGSEREAALFRLAESYRQIGNINAARRNYETLVYTFREGNFTGAGAYRLADLCFQDKDYSDAVTFYRKASVRVKDPAIALSAKFYAARSLEKMKSAGEAIAAYEDILATKENNPFREASQLSLAQVCADAGRRTEAIEHLQTLLKETDKEAVKAEASVRIGLLWLDLTQNDKAIAALTKALKMPGLGQWKEPAEIGLLRVLYDTGNFAQVLATYDSTGKQFSADAVPEVLLIVANSNRQLGKFTSARALYEQAIRDYPATVYAKEAQYERLISLYSANAPDLIQEVDAYLAQNPESNAKRDQLTLLKAESLYKVKQYAPAAPLYAALETSNLAPSFKSEALFKLGWCYAQIGDTEHAVEAFSKFLMRYPAHKLAPTALAQRALSRQQAKNFKAALQDFNELLSRYPDHGIKERELAYQQKALILGQQQENQAMADTFARLLKEYPKTKAAGQANYWIGWAAFENKNYKAAIEPLEAARKLDPEFSERATVRIILANYYSQNRDATAAEVDKAGKAGKTSKTKVPGEVLRWLGMEYLKAADALHAEHYLGLLTGRAAITQGDEATADDWLSLGKARIKLGKWNEAQTALQNYLKQVSEPIPQASGYLELGYAQLGAKDSVGAQQSVDHVMQLQPEGRINAKGRMLAGEIACTRGDFENAAKLFLSVALVYDDPEITPQALEKAYNAYKKAGMDPQAAKVLNDLQSKFPEYQVKGVQ